MCLRRRYTAAGMTRVGIVLALCAASGLARAEPRHTVYVDVLGKGGLYGIGYDARGARLAAGAVGSFYVLGGDRHLTLSPYVAVYPFRRLWFVQAGPQLVRTSTPSPVPEWDGMARTRLAAEVSSGIELHARAVIRLYGMVSIGEHVAPWVGASVGWHL